MNVVVLGSSGQLGKQVVKILDNENITVIPFTRLDWDMGSSKKSDLFQEVVNSSCDMVINTAAYTNVCGAEKDKSQAFLVNCEAVTHIVNICKKNNIPLIHISTDYVFNGTKKTPYVENDTVDPINFYGDTKAQGEKVIQGRLNRYIIIRTSWLFSFEENSFLRKIYTSLIDAGSAKVVNDQIGSPTSAVSLARFILFLTVEYREKNKLHWGVFHFANKPCASWYDLANYMMERMKELGLIDKDSCVYPCASIEWNDGVRRPLNSCLNTEKIYKKFKFKTINWKDEVDKIEFS